MIVRLAESEEDESTVMLSNCDLDVGVWWFVSGFPAPAIDFGVDTDPISTALCSKILHYPLLSRFGDIGLLEVHARGTTSLWEDSTSSLAHSSSKVMTSTLART